VAAETGISNSNVARSYQLFVSLPPIGLGYVANVTHGQKRHGTTTLFAALNVLNGAVMAAGKLRDRLQDSCCSFVRSTLARCAA
jgi:hypothetical protein